MRVSKLNKNDDWSFGRGVLDYTTKSNAVLQNLKTRIRSFQNDWFLSIDSNIDWRTILGQPSNESVIRSEIERVVLSTNGVASLDSLELITQNRKARILLTVTTIYADVVSLQVDL